MFWGREWSTMNPKQNSLLQWWLGKVRGGRQVTVWQLLTNGSIKYIHVDPWTEFLLLKNHLKSAESCLPGCRLQVQNPGPNPFSWTSRLTYVLFPTTKGRLGQKWEMVPQSQPGRFSSLKGLKSPSVFLWKVVFPTDLETTNWSLGTFLSPSTFKPNARFS